MGTDLRTLLMDRLRAREAASCALCGEPTRNGKPYCSEHVMHGSYALQVSETERAAHAEVLRVALLCARGHWRKATKEIDVRGAVIGDLRAWLSVRAGTMRAAARDTHYLAGQCDAVLDAYARALKQAGYAKQSKTKRGGTAVRRTGA